MASPRRHGAVQVFVLGETRTRLVVFQVRQYKLIASSFHPVPVSIPKLIASRFHPRLFLIIPEFLNDSRREKSRSGDRASSSAGRIRQLAVESVRRFELAEGQDPRSSVIRTDSRVVTSEGPGSGMLAMPPTFKLIFPW